jgi:hypothetical protein
VATVSIEAINMDGTLAGMVGALTVPAGGQVSRFVNEIDGLSALPSTFQGTLRVSSSQPLSVVGLRGRYNERRDFLVTTVPAVNEAIPASTLPVYFPHFATGDGYTTEFIMFSRSNDPVSAGTLSLFTPTGSSLNTAFR